ncbi:hypothetical protein EFP84_18925 [Leptospira kmetyi]|uniref:Uncharacterized protein n=1 Tax=Leptospira kmetyi TaxID=408139 RepID=A0AAD0XSD0_9LEPT|nr:hypothetical protein [Leptospira kmetyi]AYV57713.1 hypothetical protein EFP84_18925 [Leptospira kmetyi]
MDLNHIKDIFELINYISGILIAIFALIALQQLRIAKAQIIENKNTQKINVTRDTLKHTTSLIESFGKNIIPLMNVLNDEIDNKKISYFEDAKVIIDNNSFKIDSNAKKEDVSQLLKIVEPFINLMNSLESFSANLVTGIAFEKLAFQAYGATFVSTIKRLLPMILILSTDGKHFSFTLQLFILWHNRSEQEKLLKEKEILEKKIKETSEKSFYIKTVGIDDLL